jgi:hypothetical protein
MSDGALMQEPAPVTTGIDAATEPIPPSVCARCGAGRHPTYADICAKGHALPGNQLHRTHGAYSFRDRGDRSVTETLRQSADDMAAGIIADKGGVENLTTLQREFINQLRNLRIMADLLAHDLVARGLHTKSGRVRSSHSKLLETLDRLYRFGQAIGPGREPRQVADVYEYLRKVPEAASSEDHA